MSKFIGIKLSSKNNESNILINSIVISLTFAFIENLLYINTSGVSILLTRLLQPGHLFFQIIMGIFLIKSLNYTGRKKTIYKMSGILLAMVSHTIFNTFNGIEFISYIFFALGILTYIFTIIYILKKENINNENVSIKWFCLKIITIILTIIVCIFISFFNINSNLNELQKIKEDKIELRVISSEKVKIDNNQLNLLNGDFVKVKVEIINNNNSEYEVDSLRFRLVDNLYKNKSFLTFYEYDDSITSVDPGQSLEGYLYFEDDGYNYKYLIYTAGEIGNTQDYNFNILS